MAKQKKCGNVDLGFLEVAPPWRLQSRCFPSKVGGKPAWLALRDLPSEETLRCGACRKPCVFLLQVYAPIDARDDCFHRTLLVFTCRDPLCYATPHDGRCLLAFRSQLPRRNDTYDYEPPNLDADDPAVTPTPPTLCAVCGCAAAKTCSACHCVHYCTREHQTLDWKAHHKQVCKTVTAATAGTTPCSNALLFPEFELVTEPEGTDDHQEALTEEKDACSAQGEGLQKDMAMAGYKEYVERCGEGTLSDVPGTELESMASTQVMNDRQFLVFKRRIRSEPEQVLRHDRGGEPLWVSDAAGSRPDAIPPCPCGAPRQFELQVLPQLLMHLKVDALGASIDWGTIALYTCSRSCNTGATYHSEFVWKQDFATTDKSTES